MENVQRGVGGETAPDILKKMARQSMKRKAMLQAYGRERRDSLWGINRPDPQSERPRVLENKRGV